MYNDDKPLLALMDQLGISYRIDKHRPFFTAADRDEEKSKTWEFPVKNFFCYDKKKNFYLITVHIDLPSVDLRALAKHIGARGNSFSFAKEDHLQEKLKLLPGSVTPYAIFHDTECSIQVVLDENIAKAKTLSGHPMRNDQTMTIAVDDLKQLYSHTGHKPVWAHIPLRTQS